MPVARTLRSRGAKGLVVANGEVLFAPGTDLSRWKNSLSNIVTTAARTGAPSHDYGKRALRPHPGPPLKTTIKSKTSTRITKGGGFFYIGVGSSAPYSLYVNDGTGIYNNKSPWEAKVLPPYAPGSPSLYEASWTPGSGGGRGRPPVLIKGQRGTFFFDDALKKGFTAKRLRSTVVAGQGATKMKASFLTADQEAYPPINTSADVAFRARLDEWRSWRDQAFQRGAILGEGDALGRGQRRRIRQIETKARNQATARNAKLLQSREDRLRKQRERMRQYRKTQKDKGIVTDYKALKMRNQVNLRSAMKAEMESFIAATGNRYRLAGVDGRGFGFWYVDGLGTRRRRAWSRAIADRLGQ